MTIMIYLMTLWAANGQPAPLPRDAVVVVALPRLGVGLVPADVSVVKEEVAPGHWKCTAYYRRAVWTPFGPVAFGPGKTRDVYFTTPAVAPGG